MAPRILFMGTPEFAVPTLTALHDSGFEIVGAVCQPDKPAGRGQKIHVPPVKRAALALGIPVWQPTRLRDNADFLGEMAALRPELGVVIAYGKLLPQDVLDVPVRGCLNLHASLLPKYRGAAPIEWALINGETMTGVTLMKMDAGLDTGDMLAHRSCAISPEDNAASLADKLSRLSAELAVNEIPNWLKGAIQPEKQDEREATLAPLLNKSAGQIDWTQAARVIENRVRGVFVRPGAHSTLLGSPVKLRVVHALEKPCKQPPGTILGLTPDGWEVATGEQMLLVREIQLPGKTFQLACDVARGWRDLKPGDRFESPRPTPVS